MEKDIVGQVSRYGLQDFNRGTWNRETENLATITYGITDPDKINAFQHAYTSAYFTKFYGIKIANAIGYVNEFFGDNSEADHNKDFFNNSVGRQIAQNNPGDNLYQLGQKIALSIENGELITDADQEWSDSEGRRATEMQLPEFQPTPQRFQRWLDYVNSTPMVRATGDAFGIVSAIQILKEADQLLGSPLQKVLNLIIAALGAPSFDPVLIDLNGDGIKTTSLTDGIYANYFNDGFMVSTSWANSEDGVLIYDPDNSGIFLAPNQLFGTTFELPNGMLAHDGFEALASLDSNSDGVLDQNDLQFGAIKIYRSNGTVETLGEHNITSLNLAGSVSSYVDENGNQQLEVASYTTVGGGTGSIGDYNLLINPADTIAQTYLEETTTVAELPDIQGFGKMYTLHQAMLRDESGSLETLVSQFVEETDSNQQISLVRQILIQWAGVAEISPDKFGPHIDGQTVALIGKYAGTDITITSNSGRIGILQASYLEEAYQRVFNQIYAELMLQSQLSDLADQIILSRDIDSNLPILELNDIADQLISEIGQNVDNGKLRLAQFTRSIKGLSFNQIKGYAEFYNTFAALGEDYTWIMDSAGASIVEGTSSPDTLVASMLTAESWAINGGAGNDVINGGNGDSILYGGSGDDIIAAGNANDLIVGGAGNDTLYAGRGSDTFVLNSGDGQDTLYEWAAPSTPGSNDTIKFGPGITLNDVFFTPQGNNLIIGIRGSSDQILLRDGLTNLAKNVGQFVFSDGTELSMSDVLDEKLEVTLAPGTNSYLAPNLNLNIIGNDGNDVIVTGNSDNNVTTGDGNNTITAGTGSNNIYLGAGNDTVTLGNGTQTVVIGGGNDSILGGSRENAYVYNEDSGNAVIRPRGGTTHLQFGEGIAYNDLIFGASGSNLSR